MGGFKERLQELKSQQRGDYEQGRVEFWGERVSKEIEVLERSKETEPLRKLYGERYKKRVEELELLTEHFRPILDLVNEAYLDGRGKISLEKPDIEEVSKRLLFLKIRLELRWGEYDGTEGVTHLRGGHKLSLALYRIRNDRFVEIQGAGQDASTAKVKVDFTNETFLTQVQDGIYEVLSTPKATFWETHYYEYDIGSEGSHSRD